MVNIFFHLSHIDGALQVFTALDLYRVVCFDYYIFASGFLSILCGLLVKLAPVNDMVRVASIFGLFMSLYAVILIAIALEMKSSAGSPAGYSELP